MFRLKVHAIAVLLLLSLAALPVSAGGVATVHLDAAPKNVVAGVPFQIGFMVMQHDVTPVNLDHVYVFAQHRGTGETYQEDARQDGTVGHYVADLTFPKAGSWKWQIIPESFAGTSFESLLVQDAAGTLTDPNLFAHPANVHVGDCQELGDARFPLGDLAAGLVTRDGTPDTTTGAVGIDPGVPVAISTTTLDVTIAELLSSPHAINVLKNDGDNLAVACGSVSGRMIDGALIVGLQQENNSGDVGIAILQEDGERTTISLYMQVVTPQQATNGSETVIEIQTASDGSWKFEPAQVEIPAGTTVTWINKTDTAHTITGDVLAFEDSGPLAQDESFSQVFTDPGMFTYHCGPHPFMTGVVVVKGGG